MLLAFLVDWQSKGQNPNSKQDQAMEVRNSSLFQQMRPANGINHVRNITSTLLTNSIPCADLYGPGQVYPSNKASSALQSRSTLV